MRLLLLASIWSAIRFSFHNLLRASKIDKKSKIIKWARLRDFDLNCWFRNLSIFVIMRTIIRNSEIYRYIWLQWFPLSKLSLLTVKMLFSNAQYSDRHTWKGFSKQIKTPDFMNILILKGMKNTLYMDTIKEK